MTEGSRRWGGVAAGVGAGFAAITAGLTWAGVKVLTDAPTPRVRKARLTATFRSAGTDDEGPFADRDVVHLAGEEATLPGRWGLVVDGAYVQIGPPLQIREDEDGDPIAIRPYEVLDGVAPDLAHQTDRRRADRRAKGRRGRGRRGGRDPEPPTVGTERRAEDRRSDDRRHDDRRFHGDDGPWPVKATLAPYAWPEDPQILARTHDATWRIESVPAPGADLPAWVFTPATPGDDGTWLIGVHGRGARRAELFRIVHASLEAGVTCLVASYRTDAWTRNRVSVTTLGHDEWRDIESAVQVAIDNGARRIVLAGCSMGGAITAMFLRRSALAPSVRGVILDSPALNWPPIIEHVARANHVPGPLRATIMAAARVRAKIDWAALDHLGAAADFLHPILLIHGTDDDVVPQWMSDAFAEARPDLITYLVVDGAGHVHAWNHSPNRYDDHVQAFLARVSAVGAVPRRRWWAR